MENRLPEVYLGSQAVDQAVQYLRAGGRTRVTLVSDPIEYQVLGQAAEQAMQDAGLNVRTIVLQGEEILADERSIVQVLLPEDEGESVYAAVGSGTLTDIVRFASHRAGKQFISLPTAPSMDGYASDGSSLTIGGFKQTLFSRPPIAIFADMQTLKEAPRAMIAAGFGDMFGKFTATADWMLAHLLWEEPYNDDVCKRSRAAVEACAEQARAFGENWDANIQALMGGLLEEGLCMLSVSSSRPASGAEHQFSHFWEMKMLREGRKAIFHGTKVGVASVFIARFYRMIRHLSTVELEQRLEWAALPDWNKVEAGIRAAYGQIADEVIASQAKYRNMTSAAFEAYKQRIRASWFDVQAIAASVPEPEAITELLGNVGGARTPEEAGLSKDDIEQAFGYARYVRSAYSVLRLCETLQLEPSIELEPGT